MFRAAAVTLVALGLGFSLTPAQAKTEPIRNFKVTVTDTGLRASALVPGRPGRSAKLQQNADGRWITVATTRTKGAKGKTPRARWTVPFTELRSTSRVQAGPLAELVRLRAKAGTVKSKPKRVRITASSAANTPTVPDLVGGDIFTQISASGSVYFVMSGRASWEFSRLDPQDSDWATYKLVGGQLTWEAGGVNESGCTFSGSGPATVIGGEGRVQVPPVNGGDAFYDFRLRVDPLLRGIKVQCPGDPGPNTFDGPFDLSFITTDCPLTGRLQAVYQSPPWSNQNFTWGFTGSVGVGKAAFCTNVFEAPGVYYQWSLIGTDPVSAEDLAPLRRKQ
jgi:hypothetical protein